MKKVLLSTSLIILAFSLAAQSKDIKAKAAFLSAQDAYGNGDYASSAEKLEYVIELLGSTNPRVEHLLANAYLETGEVDKAEASMKLYFKLAADNDANYLSMLRMTEIIREKKEEQAEMIRKKQEEALLLERQKELENKETEAFEVASKTNTLEAYKGFLAVYPNGNSKMDALKAMNKFPSEPLTDSRDGNKYETLRIGNLIWMKEDLRLENDGTKTISKFDAIVYKSDENLGKLCPIGWRLPSTQDFLLSLTSLGLSSTINSSEHGENENKTLINRILDKPFINSITIQENWKFLNATNETGFSLIPNDAYGGVAMQSTEQYYMFLSDGYLVLWTRANNSGLNVIQTKSIPDKNHNGANQKYACRCIKDE